MSHQVEERPSKDLGTEEVAWWLRALAALSKVSGLIASTYTAVHNGYKSSPGRSSDDFWLLKAVHVCGAQTKHPYA